MRVEFDTTNYQATHGKRPRGYGLWVLIAHVGVNGSWTSENYWIHGTYGEAKKQAAHFARIEFPQATEIRIEVGS